VSQVVESEWAQAGGVARSLDAAAQGGAVEAAAEVRVLELRDPD
jgi:hypothetical protein